MLRVFSSSECKDFKDDWMRRNIENVTELIFPVTSGTVIPIRCVGGYVPLLFVSRQFVSLLLVFNNSSPLLFVSTTIRLHYYSSPLLFVSTTFRLHYYSSPLLFVFTTIRLHTMRLLTIHLHYYSYPLLFFSTKFVSNNSSPPLFVSTTIRVNYNSIIYSLVDVINNAGKKVVVEVSLVSN